MALGLGIRTLVGCAAATKLTGWFLPVPFAVWSVMYRSRRGFRTLLIGLVIAAAVVFIQVPPWWTDPIGGVTRFLSSNLGRGTTQPIQVLFLGIVYNTPIESLPWYNTLVWTVLVTPVGFLMLGRDRTRRDSAELAQRADRNPDRGPLGLRDAAPRHAARSRARWSAALPAGIWHPRPFGRARRALPRSTSRDAGAKRRSSPRSSKQSLALP